MKNTIISFLVFLASQGFVCSHAQIQPNQMKFRLGNEVLIEDRHQELKDMRVAVVTNQTGILSDGTHIIDALVSKGINVVKIFSPEHGIRGDENYSDKDEKTGIPVVSIYGEKKSPSSSDLSDVDVVIYDIQDVGARFYTYTSTLKFCLESALHNGKKFIVCDRPVIINPDYVDGFFLEDNHSSFVGSIPTSICYGMTCGELANYLTSFYRNLPNVEIIKMDGYSHSVNFNSLNIKWVKPSPSMFSASTAVCYPATCFLEGTNVSEGRGSEKPFEYFGAPWVNSNLLADELNSYNLSGVKFELITFTPSEKVSAYPPKFFNKVCNGIYINVTDKNKFEAVKCGVAILVSLNKLFHEFKFNKDNFIDKLAGTDRLRNMVRAGNNYDSIVISWKTEVNYFKETRKNFLLY